LQIEMEPMLAGMNAGVNEVRQEGEPAEHRLWIPSSCPR
jgi:hypothetical protein